MKMTRTALVGLGVITIFGLCTAGVRGQGHAVIDPDASRVLRSMSSYLGHLAAWSADFDIDTEVVDFQGQKLQYSSSGTTIVQRPNHLYVTRKNGRIDGSVYYDGKTLTVYGKVGNAYKQVALAGTIDQALDAIRQKLSLDAGAADLLYADPESGLLTNVQSGSDYGPAVVNGVACEYLAFRAKEVDWQLWVATGDRPLPLKYVITTKWVTGAPQYAVRLRNWSVNPNIDGGRFVFTPPRGAKRVDKIPTNVIGEIAGTGGR